MGAKQLRTLVMILFSFSLMPACGNTGEREIVLTDSRTELSAYRNIHESYFEAEGRFRQGLSQLKLAAYFNLHSVHSNAVDIELLDSSHLIDYTSLEDINAEFLYLRNSQFLRDSAHPELARRITWFYPDDGCYTRAEVMREQSHIAFQKIFVFGSLSSTTPYHPTGEVHWWYHVAPIFSLNQRAMVFDPSVNLNAPIDLTSWLEKIIGDGESTAAICDAGAYGPYSICYGQGFAETTRVQADIQNLLNLEWSRQEELNNEPLDSLGDSPPW